MREIKFRAFDVKLKKWQNNLCIGIQNFKSDDVVFMQYTGLKDKNNVEIYECDIVSIELDNNNYEIAEIKFNVKDGMYEVCFINSNTIEHFNDWIDITHFEIIGNIYENPELLK